MVYATSPVQRVVCEFDILGIITAPIDKLWRLTWRFGGIDRESYARYFDGLEFGHAIRIGEVRAYERPYCPVKELGVRPPQSFLYVDPPNASCSAV